MAFKSEAQRAKFQALQKEGKISKKTVDEFESKTPKNIPERVKPKENKVLTIKQMFEKSKKKLGK